MCVCVHAQTYPYLVCFLITPKHVYTVRVCHCTYDIMCDGGRETKIETVLLSRLGRASADI